jgi:hypothetical protein
MMGMRSSLAERSMAAMRPGAIAARLAAARTSGNCGAENDGTPDCFLSRRQRGGPAEIVVGAQHFHGNHRAEHDNDLHQRSRRKHSA